MPHHALRTLALAALLVATGAACDDGFTSPSELTRYRVLTLRADPPEASPDDTVTLRVIDFDPSALSDAPEPIVYSWRLCLFTFGVRTAFECADPALEFELEGDGPELTLDLAQDFGDGNPCDPATMNVRACFAAIGEIPGPDGRPITLEDGFDLLFRVTSGVEGRPGAWPGMENDFIETVKPYTVRDDQRFNQHPEIVSFEVRAAEKEADLFTVVDDSAPAGRLVELVVEVTPESVEPLPEDEANFSRDEEELLFAWYTSEGEIDPPATFGDDFDARLRLPDAPTTLMLFVVVRDGRGGTDIASKRFEVTEPLPEPE